MEKMVLTNKNRQITENAKKKNVISSSGVFQDFKHQIAGRSTKF
jgi:hypothetical protein